MIFKVLRFFPRASPSILVRATQQRVQPLPALFTRTYASNATPGQSSNVSQPRASSAEGQEINQSRATDNTKDQDSASVANPVSHPESTGLGQQEESTQSQEEMKRDPKEPDDVKRKHVLEKGGNKKLDAADD